MSISSGKTVVNRTHFETAGIEVVVSGYKIIDEFVDLACNVLSNTGEHCSVNIL